MNVKLDYDSGQSYSQYFTNLKIKVSGGGKKRVQVSFRELGNSRAYASFSLPKDKAKQLAYALLTSTGGVEQPIEFILEEEKTKVVAA